MVEHDGKGHCCSGEHCTGSVVHLSQSDSGGSTTMEKTADHCSDHIHGSVVESNGEQIHLEPELQEGSGPGYKHHSLAVKHQIGGPALMTPNRVWRKSGEAQGPSCCSSRSPGVHSMMIGAPQVHQVKEQGEEQGKEQDQGSDGPLNPGCLSSLVFLLPPQLC